MFTHTVPKSNGVRAKHPTKLWDTRAGGFTLIELVVTMAVAAILVAVAVPNMRTFIQNGRLNTQVNDLIGDLNLARSEAIKRRLVVGLCKSTDGVTFSAGPWRDGRAVVFDANNNGILCEANDTVLRFREPLASANNTLATSAVAPSIIFSANGSSNIAAGFFFTFCDDRGLSNGKQLNLNSMGQAAVITPAVGPC